MKLKTSPLLMILFFSVGCKSQSKLETTQRLAPQPPAGLVLQVPKKITQFGENSSAKFSPDGKRIVYISRLRPSHSQSQIYEMNLTTNKERRLTFQYGDTAWPSYSPDGQKVLYASTTDELKEEPLFIEKSLQRFELDKGSAKALPPNPWDWFNEDQAFEIYLNSLDNSDIHRLTHSAGFDSEPRFHPKGQKIVFVSHRTQNADLYLMAANGDLIRRLGTSPESDHYPDFSPDGSKLVWTRFHSKEPSSELLVGSGEEGKAKALPLPKGQYVHPHWLNKGEWLVFSSNWEDQSNFELYVSKNDGSCLTRLTYSLDQEFTPEISPDGTKLLFSANKDGNSQLYVMNFELPKTCANQ